METNLERWKMRTEFPAIVSPCPTMKFTNYGSLYVTLCFVLCPFDFGVLSIHFCMLCSLFVYNVAHFKRRNSRGRAKMENNRGKKDESISILIHPSLC